MTKTTKRSNAEIADSCISASEDWAAARSNQTLWEILHEAAAALREPITFSDAAVEAASKMFADAVVPIEDNSLFYFAARGYDKEIKDAGPHVVHAQRMRAALEAAIAVHNAERNGPPESKT